MVTFLKSTLVVQYPDDKLFQIPSGIYPPWKSKEETSKWEYAKGFFKKDTGVEAPGIQTFERSTTYLYLAGQMHVVFTVEASAGVATQIGATSTDDSAAIVDYYWFKADETSEDLLPETVTIMQNIKK